MGVLPSILFVLISISLASAKGKAFIYINGGGNATSNYSMHEDDISVFDDQLFENNAMILNAGGRGTRITEVRGSYSNPYFARDDLGLVKLSPSKLFYFRPEPATLANISRLFSSVKKSDPAEVTVIYGDHGSPSGISTWNGTSLDAEGIKEFYKKFPESTLIRSIHIHCFGGAAIVDPKRKVPDQLKNLSQFFSDHYLKNKCALAMGSHDELGQYFVNPSHTFDVATQSAWSQVLKKGHKYTLKGLKNYMDHWQGIIPKPVLTSDYFLSDLEKFLCDQPSSHSNLTETNYFSNCSNGSEVCPEVLRMGESIQAGANRLICKDLSNTSYQSALEMMNQEVVLFHKAFFELQNIMSKKAFEEAGVRYPKFKEAYFQEYLNYEALMAETVTSQNFSKKPDPAIMNQIKQSKTRLKTLMEKAHFTFNEDVKKERIDSEYIRNHRASYPNIYSLLFPNGVPLGWKPRQIDFMALLTEKQHFRKELYVRNQLERRRRIEEWLGQSNLLGIKERYANIIRCENSIIN